MESRLTTGGCCPVSYTHLDVYKRQPVWFLGLCQLLRGKATPSLAGLGVRALVSSAVAAVAAVAIYGLSYRTCFALIPETADIISVSETDHLSWAIKGLDLSLIHISSSLRL